LSDIPDDQVKIMKLPPLPQGTELEGVEILVKIRDKSV
jgi:hypothetical protein